MGIKLITIILLLLELVAVDSACKVSTDVHIENSCYKYFELYYTYYDAAQFCKTWGPTTYLAIVDDPLKSFYVAAIAGTTFGTTYGNFWIGAHRNSTHERFYWEDGTQLFFTNFENGFPNSFDHVAGSTIDAKWLTISPFSRLPFVCSYPYPP